MFRKLLTVVALGAVLSAVQAQITQNHESIVVTEGESMNLVCTGEVKPNVCTFYKVGSTTSYTMFEGANYESGRIEKFSNSERDCGLVVKSVREDDNGVWTCQLTLPDGSGGYQNVNGEIDVTVAVKPAEVSLRNDGENVIGEDLTFRLSEAEEATNIDCVATMARPAPTFKWFIGNEEINGDVVNTEENVDESGKGDFVQTLRYFPNAMHNEKELKCVVEHEAYSVADKEAKVNEVSKRFQLYFKPMEKPKEQVFYGLAPGKNEKITITFEANPAPTEGFWTIAGMESPVPFGATDLENKFEASQAEPVEGVRGEYSASLTIREVDPKMAGKVNKLTVTNDEGTTDYAFKLQLGEKPTADSSSVAITGEPVGSGTVVGVIILVVIILIIVIIAVVARSKGILCFATKNGEQLQEEKDAAAFDNVEKGEPLNPKTTTTNAAGDAKDKITDEGEKKSNGAHTPV